MHGHTQYAWPASHWLNPEREEPQLYGIGRQPVELDCVTLCKEICKGAYWGCPKDAIELISLHKSGAELEVVSLHHRVNKR